jgi:uncharacterized protein YgbK (DUF1537 family)
MEVFVAGLQQAEKAGNKFLCRTSATFVPIRAGMKSGKIYHPRKEEVRSPNGSLIVVGSYVPKTTIQLESLLSHQTHQAIEINVSQLLNGNAATLDEYAQGITRKADLLLQNGKDVVIYTSRKLESGRDAEDSLKIHNTVASFLVKVVKELTVRPAFIIAKGGITSSDIASKALLAETAFILGQIIPGVPVWRLDLQSRFPDLLYVVFPGNVGDASALTEVCQRMIASNEN